MSIRKHESNAHKQRYYRQNKALRCIDTVTQLQTALPESVPDGVQASFLPAPDVAVSSDDNYTPPHVISAARAALGVIDLDPASSLFAQRTVQAAQWCGLDHPDPDRRNGLAVTWYGRVWCNPPFSKDSTNPDGFLKLFTKKLVDAYLCGDVRAACILTRCDSSAAYSQLLRQHSTASCWPAQRLNFIRPTHLDRKGNPNFTTIIWYLGRASHRFIAAFERIGDTRANPTESTHRG